MVTIKGIPVCGGIAFGKIFIFTKDESMVKRYHVESSYIEIERFEAARQKAIDELDMLHKKAIRELGESNASIFQIHRLMIEDNDYVNSIKNIISDELINAETAVAITCDHFVSMFSNMKDGYLSCRDADIKDISERIIRILEGKNTDGIFTDEPVIIVAKDLSPSETVQFDKNKVLAFAATEGSANSHAAIIARTMNIPAIIQASNAFDRKYNGLNAILDGSEGILYISPNSDITEKMKQKKKQLDKQLELLENMGGAPSLTKDKNKIGLYANIAAVSDIDTVLKNDADGIGLFRSEFMYMESDTFPDEDTQFKAYKHILSEMKDKRVVIRTIDIGDNKKLNYLNLPKENNPALGMKSIRICLTQRGIFKTQLRALLRASVFGNLAIMFPMIASEWEIDRIFSLIDEVKYELQKEGVAYSSDIEIGCMIETPAAAVMSDILAQRLDFFSIGTNDLTQYTLAADRENKDIGEFLNPHHPAVMRLIKMVVYNAHSQGKWVSISGDIGADTSLTKDFIEMGVDDLSVEPPFILPLRKVITETNIYKQE